MSLIRGGKMYEVSKEYKESMKEPIRNRSYMRVILGIINLEAQNTAVVEESPQLTSYSDEKSIFIKNDIGNIYATYEKDFFKADGSMFFLPRSGDYRKNGITVDHLFPEDSVDSLTISFSLSDVRGLTIQFGDNYPTLFSISTSSGYEIEFENNNSYFQTDMIFESITSITLNIKKMLKPHGRLRIFFFKLGVVAEYDNEWIINTESSSSVSMINENLPGSSFSVVLKNEDLRFNPDNPDSEINFLEPGQLLSVMYGYEVSENVIEWMQLHTLYVSEWSANDSQATISAVDKFQYMNGNYYRGIYHSEGISLFDLAEEVFMDAGINPEDYVIDEYLKDIKVNNPIPNVTHKEALQIIANAGRALLEYDRYGKIRLTQAFIPDVTIETNGAEYFSNVQSLNEDYEKNLYASYQKDYWIADGKMLFVPRAGVQNNGYVSAQISGNDCIFDTNPIITQILEMPYQCYGFRIIFSNNLPKEFIIRTYLKDAIVDSFSITDIEEPRFELMKELNTFDKVQIEFLRTKYPNQRIQIDQIAFGADSDYKIEYDDLYSTPTGTQLQKIKNLNVARTIYSSGSEEQDLSSDTFSYDGENKTYFFSEPSYGYSVSVQEGNGSVSIVSSGAYFVEFSISGVSIGEQVKIAIKGHKYNLSTAYYTTAINNRGNDITWSNPLISDSSHCKDVAEWVAEYEKSEIEYELDFRGEPALDCGDTIFQENKYVDNLKVVIEEHQMTFNGTIDGALKTRRRERVERAENKLGVGRLL